ncbi:DUF1801 domain-containing protein [Aquimarina addita]|uniref:DUF1801 domain-containing protein n=1 Tax=Aquimarina addita TaxID=870485 RepID=A0ABP7XCC5_9FLAO
MQYKATTPDEYIKQIPKERQATIQKLRDVIQHNLPKGFSEKISYGMIAYVVPHSIYPDGYHCNPKLPLPFISIASQKNYIAIYHSGLYAQKDLFNWFVDEYPKHVKTKLDIGKSCIRFKKPDQIPFGLIGELSAKMTPKEWVDIYKKVLNKK